MSKLRAVWRFVDRIGWIIAIFFVLVAFAEIHRDEQATKSSAARTRLIQKQGEPVGVCLLDTMRAVSPLLLKVPSVEKPLNAYVRLQSRRYQNVPCPESP